MKFQNLFAFLFLLLISCSSTLYRPRVIEDYYQSAGIEKYFLTDIPSWANFSERANCYRNLNIRFFEIDQLMKNFDLDYNKAIQIQAVYNDDYFRLYGTQSKVIALQDEQGLFYKSLEKINGKIRFFESPSFKRIHLIWIDSMLKNSEEENKLKMFLKSPLQDEGVPVLVSMCLSRIEIERKFPDYNYKSISAEMMSVFHPNGTKTPLMKFFFDQYFSKDQQLVFYSRERIQSSLEFNGKLKFSNF